MDILFHVSTLCRYMSAYNKEVYSYAIKLLKYLKGTQSYGVVYDCSSMDQSKYGDGIELAFFVDSDWGGRKEDSKSTTGIIVQANGVPVFAVSKCQRRPAVSTAESEFNGVEFACKEVEWYRNFLVELQVNVTKPTTMWQDNTATISLTKDPVNPSRTKYFRIAQAYVRWCATAGIIACRYLKSEMMPCDLLNKLTCKPTFVKHLPMVMGNQSLSCAGAVNLARVKQCFRRKPIKIKQRERAISDVP